MSRQIIGFNEVIELNHRLEDKSLYFKVHLHDACGSQSFSVEALSQCGCEGHCEEMQEAVLEYFGEKGISVTFLENGMDFVLRD